MDLKELCKRANLNAEKHGFWEEFNLIGLLAEWGDKNHLKSLENALVSQRLMLIVGEVAEAQEALRKDNKENFKEELADIAIRLFDLCGGLGVDLQEEVEKKMKYNESRPYKHNKAF